MKGNERENTKIMSKKKKSSKAFCDMQRKASGSGRAVGGREAKLDEAEAHTLNQVL